MANINEILARAAALRNETALNSIDPERAGGIMYDTLLALNELWLQQGAALVISKIYASVAAMNADTSPVSDLTGKPIRPGMVVVIASSDSDNGSVYRYNGTSDPRWSLVGKIGNITPEDSLTSDSTQLPLAAHQGKVLDGKISQLGQDVAEGFVVRPVQTTENLLDAFDIYKIRPDVTYNNGEIIGTLVAFKKNEEAIPLNCKPGRYVISCKAYCEGNVTTLGYGLQCKVFYTDSTQESNMDFSLLNSANSWTDLKFPTDPDKTVDYIVLRYSAGGDNIVHIKEFQVRKASIVLPYIPSKSAYDANAQVSIDAQKAKLGYYICSSNQSLNKIVDAPGYKLEDGGSIKIKFSNNNTRDNCTLNINNTGEKLLKLDGENVSFYDNNIIKDSIYEVYYDGEYYQAKLVKNSLNVDVYSVAGQMGYDFVYNNFFNGSYVEVSEGNRKMQLTTPSPTRLSSIFPFPSCELTMSGNVTNAGLGCFVVDDIVSYNNKCLHYIVRSISGLEGYLFRLEYDSDSDTTKITIKCKKPVIFALRNAIDGNANINSEVVSYVRTDGNVVLEEEIALINGGVAALSGMVADNLTLGGYSSVSSEQTVSFVKNNYRISTIYPVKSGTFKFYGELRWIASPGVDSIVEFTDNKRVYHVVTGVLKQRSVEYDRINDITTLSFVATAPILPVFGKANNSAFDSIDFISFEEDSGAQSFNIPLKYTNPFNGSIDITCFSEPTIVMADDGAIIIASTCGESNAYENNMISISHDGGKTWTSTLNEGESVGWQQMVWDKQNHRLVALKGKYAYYSEDYGTTWTLLAEDVHDNEIYPNQGGTMPNTVSQEMKALVDYYNSLDDGFEYSAEWTQYRNPGVQLANGVIAFARGTSLKKKNPYTHAEVSMITSQAFVVFSKDFGNTWEMPVFLPLYRNVNGEDVLATTNETCICEALENQICMNSRGGTEAMYGESVNVRRIFFQHTPVNDRSQFIIDSWEADYNTRASNTISDSIVNAALTKVSNYVPQGSNAQSVNFWLFANIDNPNGTARTTQLLRLSTDAHNWVNVCVLSANNDYIKGYIGITSDGHNIYIVMEGNRNEPLRFIVLDYYMLGELLNAYLASKTFFGAS